MSADQLNIIVAARSAKCAYGFHMACDKPLTCGCPCHTRPVGAK